MISAYGSGNQPRYQFVIDGCGQDAGGVPIHGVRGPQSHGRRAVSSRLPRGLVIGDDPGR